MDQVKVAAMFSNLITDAEEKVLYSSIELDELKKVISKFKIDKSRGLMDGQPISLFTISI
jgi:hypothetical protein